MQNWGMVENILEPRLLGVDEAASVLGGISPWTLRKHIEFGNVKVTRIGRRVFLDAEEVERIRRVGLPSLARSRAKQIEVTR
jgi:hypothetical protein